MQRAMTSLRDNADFYNLYLAGLGRDRADWLIGMNLSRAYSVSLRKNGYSQARFNIERVKMPTLALVVRREREINHFVPQNYYELIGIYSHQGVPFKAKYVPKDSLPVDPENRILDKGVLAAILSNVSSSQAQVDTVNRKHSLSQPPLPHSLDTLQVLANKKYGFSPKTTLDTVQELYEKNTYPIPEVTATTSRRHNSLMLRLF